MYLSMGNRSHAGQGRESRSGICSLGGVVTVFPPSRKARPGRSLHSRPSFRASASSTEVASPSPRTAASSAQPSRYIRGSVVAPVLPAIRNAPGTSLRRALPSSFAYL